MFGSSTIDTLEVEFKSKGLPEIQKSAYIVDELAKKITKDVKDSYDSMSKSFANTVGTLENTLLFYKSSIDASRMNTNLQLRAWLNDTVKFFIEQQRALTDNFQHYVGKPMGRAYDYIVGNIRDAYNDITETTGLFLALQKERLKDASAALHDMLSPYVVTFLASVQKQKARVFAAFEDILIARPRQAFADFYTYLETTYPNAFGFIATSWNKTSEIITQTWSRLQTVFGMAEKVLTGPWLMVKSIVLATTSLALKMPTYLQNIVTDVVKIGGAIGAAFYASHLWVKAGWKALTEYSTQVWTSLKDTAKLYAQLTGLSALWTGLSKATTWTLKITGVAAVAAAISGAMKGTFSFMETFTKTMEAVLAPVAQLLNDLMVQLIPLLTTVLTPLVEIANQVLKSLMVAFQDLLATDGPFSQVLSSLMEVVRLIGYMVGTMLKDLITVALPPLMQIFTLVVQVFQDLLTPLLKTFFPLLESLLPLISKVFQDLIPVVMLIFESVKELLPSFLELILTAVSALMPIVTMLLPLLLPAIRMIVTVLRDLLVILMPILTVVVQIVEWIGRLVVIPLIVAAVYTVIAPIYALVVVLRGAFDMLMSFLHMIKTFVMSLPEIISDVFAWIITAIPRMMTSLWESISTIMSAIYSFLGLDKLSNMLSGFFSVVLKILMAPIHAVVWLINAILEPLRWLLSWDPPVIPGGTIGEMSGLSIPEVKLAEGGVVTRPTLATIGEAGPEVVLPLKPNIIKEIVPSLMNVSPVVNMPDKVEITHGSEIVRILTLINDGLRALEMPQVTLEPSVMSMHPILDFGLQGFRT